MLRDERFDLLYLLRQDLLVLLCERGLGPLQPAQQALQQLLSGQKLTESSGQPLLMLPRPCCDLTHSKIEEQEE